LKSGAIVLTLPYKIKIIMSKKINIIDLSNGDDIYLSFPLYL
jgi:hypothetical protein